MLQNEINSNNAVCIGGNNNLNIYAPLNYEDMPHFNDKCFVICWVQYLDDNKEIELYFNDKKRWVVNNINKAKHFTYKEALKELFFINQTAGYGLKDFLNGELQLIDLYIYYSDEDDL